MPRMSNHEYLVLLCENENSTIPLESSTYQYVWTHIIPGLREEISTLNMLVEHFKNNHNDKRKWCIEKEIESITNTISRFSKMYPEPTVTTIEDTEHYDDNWLSLAETAIVSVLPSEPMTLISPLNESCLIYRDSNNNYYKTANMWYNRPGYRKIVTFPT